MKKLPRPPKFTVFALGPGIVLIAMGLGSGEFILWPYLAAEAGFGVLWGAIVGITLQLFVSNESGRYTLLTGESVFVGFHKLWKPWSNWFVLSTFLSFAWPGIIASGAQVLGYALDFKNTTLLTIILLLIIGYLLTSGGKVYQSVKKIQIIAISISIPLLIFIAINVVDVSTIISILKGSIGIGDGYLFFPGSVSLAAFLGAIAYSGGGGNLILSHSYYLQGEKSGMAKYDDKDFSISTKSEFEIKETRFKLTTQNISFFNKWVRNSFIEQFISFWGIGIISIVILMSISYSLVYPYTGEEGLGFILLQSELILDKLGLTFKTIFLAVGATFLFTTQLGVFESTSRIITENLQLSFSKLRDMQASRIFFIIVWMQILFGIVVALMDIGTPLEILIINTTFSAISMFALSVAIFLLGRSKLIDHVIQAGRLKKTVILISVIFFGLFSFFVVFQ